MIKNISNIITSKFNRSFRKNLIYTKLFKDEKDLVQSIITPTNSIPIISVFFNESEWIFITPTEILMKKDSISISILFKDIIDLKCDFKKYKNIKERDEIEIFTIRELYTVRFEKGSWGPMIDILAFLKNFNTENL